MGAGADTTNKVLSNADIIRICVPAGNGLMATSSTAALLCTDPSVAKYFHEFLLFI
jgi:hypothetical protein